MFALALGIKNVDDTLPAAVYALLSGLNSATVGIIALAAVQLAEKAITDKVSRLLVVFGACAGLCYTALWYFPVLIIIGGIVTMLWDCWARGAVGRYRERRKQRKSGKAVARDSDGGNSGVPLEPITPKGAVLEEGSNLQHRRPTAVDDEGLQKDMERQAAAKTPEAGPSVPVQEAEEAESTWNRIEGTDMLAHAIPVKAGIAIIILFFGTSRPVIYMSPTNH